MQNPRPTPRPAGTPPGAEGLYDPRFEHDSCGVGFVVNIKGERSHKLVRQAFEVSVNLLHRGACGCEVNTGRRRRHAAAVAAQVLPEGGRRRRLRAARAGFLRRRHGVPAGADAAERRQVEATFDRIVEEEGQRLLGWRDVPTDSGHLGATARSGEPVIRQIFIGRDPALDDTPDAGARFERKLYVIRNRAAHETDRLQLRERDLFYVASLSSNTDRLQGHADRGPGGADVPRPGGPPTSSRALALVHSRFSTNTFPSWPLAHPYRYCAHNGENQHAARQHQLDAGARGAVPVGFSSATTCRSCSPLVREGQSDTATFDNVLEVPGPPPAGPLAHAVLMMIPEPWSNHESMSPERRAFYEYHASLMEPWDGPASIAFTDGTVIGAVLDRNGLRPLALLRDEGRHGDHGVRGGRPRHPAGERPGQGAAASGPHLSGRHGPGAHRRRRGDQARPCPASTRTRPG